MNVIEVVTVKEAAELLHTSPATVRRMIRTGELKASRPARRAYLIHKADIEARLKPHVFLADGVTDITASRRVTEAYAVGNAHRVMDELEARQDQREARQDQIEASLTRSETILGAYL